ncbi:MAG: oligosaccharide flippase family protein [Rhodanobacter sp.]
MSTRTLTLRNTLLSSVGIYTEYALGMLAAIMIARHLGPEHYGIYGLFMWFVSVGLVITNSGITTGVIKFVAELRGSDQNDLIVPTVKRFRRVQRLHMLAALLIGVVLYATLGGRLAVSMNHTEFFLLLISVVMRASYMFNIAVAKGFEAFGATAKVAMVASPVNLGLVAIAMLLEGSILWFLVVYVASSSVFVLVSHVQARRLIAGLPKLAILPPELVQRMRRHLRIVSATVIIGFLIASDVEMLFLTMYDSAASAGYFKVAYQLASGIILLVPGVFGALLLPMMAKALSQGREVAGRRFVMVTSYLVLLAVPVVVFGMCFAGPVIGLLYGHSYAAAAPVFALIIFAGGIGTATQGASSLLISADRQQTILIMTIIFGVLKLALDVVLISHFGLFGAVTAIVTGALVSSTVYVLLGIRVSGARLQWGRLLRTIAAGLGAALVALPVLGLHLLPIWTLLIGGIMVSVTYILLTLVLGCWSEDDIEQLQELHQRFVGGRPRLLGQLLGWASVRAGRQS